MKNKKFTITIAELNSENYIIKTILMEIDKSKSGISKIEKWYPQQIHIVNDSGKDIEWNLFRDQSEINEANNTPNNFSDIFTPDGTGAASSELPQSTIFRIKGIVGKTATIDLNVRFLIYYKKR